MFRQAGPTGRAVRFNSDASCDFIQLYNTVVENEIIEHNAQPKKKTFAPSSFHCDRVNWFRLRGVQPDVNTTPDKGLDFTAKIGTALHEIIQQRLSTCDQLEWLDVADYLKQHSSYTVTCETNGYETRVSIQDPPVNFACDGLIKFKGKIFLLEIKSAEFSSLQELIEPKPHHLDQVRCYSTLLNVPDVLVMYIDRQYGDIKCFEVHFTEADHDAVRKKLAEIQELANACIAPEKLPPGDSWCSASMCSYYMKCKEW